MQPLKKLAYIVSFLFLVANTSAQTKKENKDNNLAFELSPYGWLAGMATDVGGERIRQSFNDLASITNTGFQIAGLARYKKWYFHSNFTFANLQGGETLGNSSIDLNIVQLIWDNKIGYLVIDKVDEDDGIIRGWSMETTIGAIYWSNDVTVNLKIGDLPLPPLEIEQKQNWTDLVVGVNFNIILSKTVNLQLASNIGGFGIGNSSNIYWDIFYANTFRVSKLLSVTAGYKTFNYKREDGVGANTLETKVTTFGPLLGVSFHL